MRKKVFIAGSILALFLILGTRAAFADNGQAEKRRHAPTEFSAAIAERLQLSVDDVESIRVELASGKSAQEVLRERGITLDQIRAALGSVAKQHHRLSNTELVTLAKRLGLDPVVIQSELEAGKSFREILRDHNVSADRIRDLFDNNHTNRSFNKKQR